MSQSSNYNNPDESGTQIYFGGIPGICPFGMKVHSPPPSGLNKTTKKWKIKTNVQLPPFRTGIAKIMETCQVHKIQRWISLILSFLKNLIPKYQIQKIKYSRTMEQNKDKMTI